MVVRRLERSYFSKSGWLISMLIIVGTRTILVALCSEIACITAKASNFGSKMCVPPRHRDVEQRIGTGEMEETGDIDEAEILDVWQHREVGDRRDEERPVGHHHAFRVRSGAAGVENHPEVFAAPIGVGHRLMPRDEVFIPEHPFGNLALADIDQGLHPGELTPEFP